MELVKEDGRIVPRDRWVSRKLRIHLGNAVRVGDCVYGSSGGGGGPAFLVALDIKTGKRLWIERGFGGATCLYADDKLIILDEEGRVVHAFAAFTDRFADIVTDSLLLAFLITAAFSIVGWMTVRPLFGLRPSMSDRRAFLRPCGPQRRDDLRRLAGGQPGADP